MPDLYFRDGKGSPGENSASVKAAGGMSDDRCLGDVQGAIAFLFLLPYHNDKVGVIVYCSGSRQAYLTVCKLPGIDAAVSGYGGGVAAPPEELTERQPVAPIDFTETLVCPLLEFFEKEDKRPSSADAAKTEGSSQAF
jgi:carboxymethylenebutenolidase